MEEAPAGCALSAIGETSVYLLVRGQVDISAEITKLEQKAGKLQSLHDTLYAKTQVDGYKQVKAEIVAENEEKLARYKTEIQSINDAISQFEKLK